MISAKYAVDAKLFVEASINYCVQITHKQVIKQKRDGIVLPPTQKYVCIVKATQVVLYFSIGSEPTMRKKFLPLLKWISLWFFESLIIKLNTFLIAT